MNRKIIAKEVLKIAKELVASSNMDSFPLKSQLRKVTIDFDVDNPLYTDDMDWGSEKISDTLVFSDKTKIVSNITVYVFGFSGDVSKQGVFLSIEEDRRGWKHKQIRYFGSIKKAFGNGSNSITDYYDNDEEELAEVYDDLTEEDIKKIVSNGKTLFEKVKNSALRLSKSIGK